MAINTTDVNIILERLEGSTRKSHQTTAVAGVEVPVSDIAVLKSNDLFGQVPDEELEALVELGETRRFECGSWLFEAGEPCTRIYAVQRGIVEIRRKYEGDDGRAALLGPGEVIGLLGALTGGKHRSGGFMPEGAEVLIIEGERFAASLEQFPVISATLVRDLAGRLMGVVKKSDLVPSSLRQLEGSLAHFDLAVVLQSLIANETSAGTLTILDENDDAVADVLLGCGRIVACRFRDQTDLKAFQELFLVDHAKLRFFYVESDEAGRAAECCEMGLGGMSGVGLLMDCARIVDENRRLESGPLGHPQTRLRRSTVESEWEDRETAHLFRRLIRRLGKVRSVGELLALEKASRFEILSLLDWMIEEGQIEIVS